MPDCDGFELGRRIAGDPRFQAYPARAADLRRRAMRGAEDFAELGFAAYLLKPVSHRELRECLRTGHVGGRLSVA